MGPASAQHLKFSGDQRDLGVPPAFTLILTAFTMTTNGLTLFVEGQVFVAVCRGDFVAGRAGEGGLPLLSAILIFLEFRAFQSSSYSPPPNKTLPPPFEVSFRIA